MSIRSILAALCIFLFSVSFGQASDTLRGKVETETGAAAAGVKVYISKKKSGISDKNGFFSIPISGRLKMPLDLKIENESYHLNEYVFLEDENFLEVYVSAVNLKPKSAEIQIPEQQKPQALEKQEANNQVAESELPPVQDTLIDEELVKHTHFKQYKDDINKVVEDLREERQRIEESNKSIQEEIVRISEKLRSETNLSDEQRAELENYMLTLEKTVHDNNEAFAKAQERTHVLISRLKDIIVEKDAQIEQVVKEKELVEKKLNRNVIIFSIISFSLLLLAVVFYTIAYKMKNQKRSLIISNSELVKSRNELNDQMKEMERHRKLIEEQNEKLDIFTYKVSHDLKGPLRAITKLAELAQMNKAKFPEEELSHIGKSSVKLSKLVDDFLNLSKSKEGALQISKVDFSRLVSDCIERLENMPEAKSVSIHTDVEKGINFNSDERILLSVVQNLLENAIKYQDPQKGKKSITLTVKKAGKEKLLLEVKDNGLGISEERLPQIFDMFYKVNPDSTGSGLGLYITRSNIEKLGGTIEVDSKEGEGTSFTVTFAIAEAETVS